MKTQQAKITFLKVLFSLDKFLDESIFLIVQLPIPFPFPEPLPHRSL